MTKKTTIQNARKGNKNTSGKKTNIDIKSLNEASLAFDALINRAVNK